MGGGGKTATTTSQVQIPQQVLDRYNQVNQIAEKAASQPFQQYSTDPNAFVAPINQQEQAGFGTINTSAGSYQPALAAGEGLTAANASLNPSEVGKWLSPYLSTVAGTTEHLLSQGNQQQQAGQLGNAIRSGAFGGDRAGIAAANLNQQQELANANVISGLMNQGYQSALQTAQQQQQTGLQAGQQLAGLGLAGTQAGLAAGQAQVGAGQLGQQTEQAGKTALYNQFMQQKGYPFQTAQFLANIAEGTGALSGSTTQTTQPAPFWSDRRVKTDIRKIGKANNGLPIYTFRYKDDPDNVLHLGLMADEVEKKHPDAVSEHHGVKAVDYERATRAEGGLVAANSGMGVKNAVGGGIAGLYGQAQGYVPGASLPVGSLAVAQAPSYIPSPSNPLGVLKGIEDVYNLGKPILMGQAATKDAKATKGLMGFGGQWNPSKGYFANGGFVPDTSKSYVPDNTPVNQPHLVTGPSPSSGGSGDGTLGDLASLASSIATIAPMFNKGGRVGLAGGGVPPSDTYDPSQLDWGNPVSNFLGEVGAKVGDWMRGESATKAKQFNADIHPNEVAPQIPAPMPVDKVTGLARSVIDRSTPTPSSPGLAPPAPAGTAPQPSPEVVPSSTPAPQPSPGLAPPVSKPTEPNVADATWGRMLNIESGGHQTRPDGTVVTSYKGAIGAAQVLPSTGPEAARMAGVAWDPALFQATTPAGQAYNEKLGRAYFDHQMKTFGDPALAAAAYNAGPGVVQSALDRSAITGKSWLNYVPAETQKYVANATGISVPSSGGKMYASTAPSSEPSPGVAPSSGHPGFLDTVKSGLKNPNVILPILEGLGAMASSPSRYLGATILQGLGAGAKGYEDLQKQQADIAAKAAATANEGIQSAWNSIKEIQGTPYVLLKNGGVQPYYDWLKTPVSPSAGGTAADRALRSGSAYFSRIWGPQPSVTPAVPSQTGAAAPGVTSTPPVAPTAPVAPGAGLPAPAAPAPAPSGVYMDPQAIAAAKSEQTLMQGLGQQAALQQSQAIVNRASADANVAYQNHNNLAVQATALADANATGGFVSGVGPGANVRSDITNAINYVMRGLGLEPFSTLPSSKEIIDKINTLSASQRAAAGAQTSYNTLSRIANILPNLTQDPRASGEIFATIMQQNQRDIDENNFINAYRAQGTSKTAIKAPQEFARLYQQEYDQERPLLTALLTGVDPNNPNGPVNPNYAKYMKLLTSGKGTPQQIQETLQKAFPGQKIPPYMYRYFTARGQG